MSSRRRFRMISSSTLRAWLAALDACPDYLPIVVDLRISVRNELWLRDREEEGEEGWLLQPVKGRPS